MILVIDNYDSFVHNIARYFERAGEECTIVRNDKITVAQARAMNPAAIVISPGPCTPAQAGISVELIRRLGFYTPVLGICLGHQCIGEAYDGETIRTRPMHGKSSTITHDGNGIFANLPEQITVGRYHSLVTKPSIDSLLIITAQTAEGEIMAMQHVDHPVYGVQFHPESILTEHGFKIIENFVALTNKRKKLRKIAA